MAWISRREWRRHIRELARETKRANEAEAFSHNLINRWLTKNGSMGIPTTPQASTQVSQSPTASHAKPDEVSGWSEEDFIQQLVDDGMSRAEAQATWKRTKEFKLLPYQIEGELSS